MGKGRGYFNVGGYQTSPDNRLLAYAEDVVGRRQYVLRVKEIASGRVLPDEVPNAEPDFVWADDNRTLFYVEKDPVTLLSKRVKAHVLGTPATADRLVYEEKDESFYMGLMRTTSDKYVCIVLQSTVSNEQRCAPAARPEAFAVFAPREREFRYQADHIGGRWVVLTNWKAPNYRLMRVSEAAAGEGRAGWNDLVGHKADVFIDDFKPMDGYIAIAERSGGNKRLRLLTDSGKSSFVASDEPAYAMGLDVNAEPGTDWLRYHYTSLTTPARIYEVNARSGERRLLKETPAPGYDPSKYITERVWATARDGTRIPVSLVYRKGFRKDGKAAMLQYAYGSYGISSDPAWSPR
jgi:oligopeptidase B